VSRRITVPDGAEFRQRWQRLDRAGKKRVRRAVKRGEACDKRSEAALAAVVGRQQRLAWLITWPVVAILVALPTSPQGPLAVLVTLAVATVVYAPFALWFHRRARRAVARNLAVVEGRGTATRR
jgi:hypothetical protein